MLANFKFRKQKGQSLIELILVTVVVASVLTALAASMSMSAKNTNENKKLSIATSLVQEALEVFHRERYALGWDTFETTLVNGVYCFNTIPQNSEEFANITFGECGISDFMVDTNYQREVEVIILSGEVEVIATVSWMADGDEKQVQASQTFREIN